MAQNTVSDDESQKPSDYYQITVVDTLENWVEIDCRSVIHALGLDFALANALKYIWRAGKKTKDPTEDIRKAADYLMWWLHKRDDA